MIAILELSFRYFLGLWDLCDFSDLNKILIQDIYLSRTHGTYSRSKMSEAFRRRDQHGGTSCRNLADSTLNMLGHFLKVSNSWLMKHAPHRNYKVYPQVPYIGVLDVAAPPNVPQLMDKNPANKLFGKPHSPLQVSRHLKSLEMLRTGGFVPSKNRMGILFALGGGQGVVVSCGNCCRP